MVKLAKHSGRRLPALCLLHKVPFTLDGHPAEEWNLYKYGAYRYRCSVSDVCGNVCGVLCGYAYGMVGVQSVKNDRK